MIHTTVLRANGLSFTTRVSGPDDGTPVVFLHGFPDRSAGFDPVLERLGAAGYRCLAPTMRGYEPSSRPDDGNHSLMALASDVVGWLDDAGAERAHIVGHDWGAAVAYVMATQHSERCLRVAALAIPPLPRIPPALRRVPRQLLLSWYMTFFQLRWVAERALPARDWALLRWFWPRWSPGLSAPDDLVATFERPGVLDSALAYYRQNATPLLLLGLRQTPAMEPLPYRPPVLILHGDRDGCMDARLFDHAIVEDDYPAGVRHETVQGTGHFLHIEDPDQVGTILTEWLAGPPS